MYLVQAHLYLHAPLGIQVIISCQPVLQCFQERNDVKREHIVGQVSVTLWIQSQSWGADTESFTHYFEGIKTLRIGKDLGNFTKKMLFFKHLKLRCTAKKNPDLPLALSHLLFLFN